MPYAVDVIRTRWFSGTLREKRIERLLEERENTGWDFKYSLSNTQRRFFIFARDAHFFIFHRHTPAE